MDDQRDEKGSIQGEPTKGPFDEAFYQPKTQTIRPKNEKARGGGKMHTRNQKRAKGKQGRRDKLINVIKKQTTTTTEDREITGGCAL